MESNRIINVVGWYWKKNIGDEAYKLAFEKVWPNAKFTFSDSPEEADYHIVGGGDVLSPTLLESMNKIENKSIMSVAFPFHADKENLQGYDRIWVRDQYSLDNAEKCGVKAELVPDLAFVLEPQMTEGRDYIQELFRKEGLDLYSRRIGVVINSHIAPSHDSSAAKVAQFERFCWELASFMDNYSASFILIPFGTSFPWDDRAAASAVASKCKFWKKNCVVYERRNVQETLNMISALNVVISTRLHSSIFSTISNTPLIDITHNHKNPNFLKSIKQEDSSLPYSSFCKSKLKKMLDSKVSYPDRSRNELKAITNEQRRILKRYTDAVSFV